MEISKQSAKKIPNVKAIIGVVSGKGGVGKTFVASSLALALAKSGKVAGLFDADISCPNIFKILGIQEKLQQTNENKIIPVEKWGVKTVSMAGLCAVEDEPIVWRGPIISKILQQMLMQTVWGQLDVLVVDFPTGAGDAVLTVLQNFVVDGLIVVTGPQALAMLDAKRTIKMAGMIKTPVIGVVENMRGEIFGEGGGAKIADMFRLPLLASIPMRKQIAALCDQGTPPLFQMEELEMMFTKISRVVVEKLAV